MWIAALYPMLNNIFVSHRIVSYISPLQTIENGPWPFSRSVCIFVCVVP